MEWENLFADRKKVKRIVNRLDRLKTDDCMNFLLNQIFCLICVQQLLSRIRVCILLQEEEKNRSGLFDYEFILQKGSKLFTDPKTNHTFGLGKVLQTKRIHTSMVLTISLNLGWKRLCHSSCHTRNNITNPHFYQSTIVLIIFRKRHHCNELNQ